MLFDQTGEKRVCRHRHYQRGNSNSDDPAFLPSFAFLSSAASETSRYETATYYSGVKGLTWLISTVPGEAWPRSGWAWCLWRCAGLTDAGGVSCWKTCPWRFGSCSPCLHFLCPDSDGDEGSKAAAGVTACDYPRVLTRHLWPAAQVPWG